MKKRLAIFLLGLGSLAAVSVYAGNNYPVQDATTPTEQCTPAPCDTVPCNPCDTVCTNLPCNTEVPCNPAPCNTPVPCTPAPCYTGC